MKTILFGIGDYISEDTAPGSRVLRLSSGFNSNGFKTKLLSYNSLTNHKKKSGNNIFKKISLNYSLSQKIIEYSKKEDCVIISRGIYLAIFLGYFSLFNKITYGIDFHCKLDSITEWLYNRNYLSVGFFSPLFLLSIMKSNFTIGITAPICDNLSKSFGKKAFCIPNGISLKSLQSKIDNASSTIKLPVKKKYVFFIGHQEPWVPLDDFMEASEDLTNYGFVVIGESQNYKYYSKKYTSAIFLGKLSNKETLNLAKKHADFFFHPYQNNEIWKYKSSRKLLEYVALEKPILINTKKFLPEGLLEYKNIVLYSDYRSLINILKESNTKINHSKFKLKPFSWSELIINSGILKYQKLN